MTGFPPSPVGGFLFVADVHLAEDEPRRSERFFAFLRFARGCRGLFVLGDLFDVWLGDDDSSALATETRAALAELTGSRTPVFVQRGNRDFLLGMRFMRKTGCSLLPDWYPLEAAGGRWLLTHGDLLSGDRRYHRWRRVCRNPLVTGVFSMLSMERRRGIARRLRSHSNRARVEETVDEGRVGECLARYRCQTVIHGHFHDAVAGTAGVARSHVCLPDWERAAGYGEMTGEGLVLRDWGDSDGDG